MVGKDTFVSPGSTTTDTTYTKVGFADVLVLFYNDSLASKRKSACDFYA